MIAAVSLPAAVNIPLFILFNAVANLTAATIQLNPFQCLLQVLDEKYKTISISIFTVLTCLSNAVMPFSGVILYHSLGGDLNALRGAFWMVFVLRISAGLLWLFRWRIVSKNG
jgi:hypothetical protein